MLLRTSALALVMTAACNAGGALAQSGAAADAQESGDVIVVTAQRREQNLLDVPVSVAVVSGDTLEKEGVTSTAELEALVPSLDFPSSGARSYTRPLIRGIGDGINNGTDSNVGVYIDDVPLPTFLASFDLIDVERVEVLRGPQGTLFGQNSLAGAINVITRDATDEVKASLQLGYGSFDEYDVQAYVSGPLADGVRGKLVASYNEYGGFVDNTATGGKIDPSETIGLRGVLSADLSDQLTADLTLDYNDHDGSFTDSVPLGLLEKNEPLGNFSIRETFGAALKLNYEGENFSVTSISAYREFTNEDQLTIASTGGDTFAGFTNDQSQFTQEVRLSSTFGQNIDWLVGAYYYDESFTQDQATEVVGLFNLTFDGDGDTQTYAVFGDVTIAVTPKFDIVGGLRYTSVDTEGDVVTNLNGFVFDNTPEVSSERVSARAALLYRLTDEVTIFGSYANGFKPGQFSFYSLTPNDPTVEEETSDSYELGLRGSALDGRLDFDVVGFYVEYDQRQILADVPGSFGGLVGLANAGDGSTSQGIEVALGLQVTNNFRLTGSLATADTELNGFVVNQFIATGFDFVNLTPIGSDVLVDLSGNAFSLAPELRATIGWDYTHPLSDNMDGFIRGRWRYVDDQFATDDNDPATAIDSYNLTSLSVGVETEKFVFSVDANNLFDEYYPENLQVDAGSGDILAVPGVPQSFMARVRFNY
ncbi:MAG: TonB-dependent receptor, partial [Pseudomonadota bacterium]